MSNEQREQLKVRWGIGVSEPTIKAIMTPNGVEILDKPVTAKELLGKLEQELCSPTTLEF